MKRLTMLILLVMMNLICSSQIVTDSTLIQLKKPVVRLVIKDLIKGDSFKEELLLISTKVIFLENKIVLKDSIISNFEQQVNNYNSILLLNKSQFELAESLNEELKSSLRKQKFKTRLVGGVGIIAIVGTIYLLK